ncbi:hypothetical protein AQUCO_05100005v1 [Aquilegia coerulea]|uniref:Protein NUCLEAR FUSION DEFECTIVE 6, chloroplastic/mitochondrial-like n=1 Tax=Aquilegia coerulea TaxID=218851 RepID=A0A2G5CJ40_AQUCA|nr:hypothetical protein AQUCO_05100005v1 [Aquilegia coerulea]
MASTTIRSAFRSSSSLHGVTYKKLTTQAKPKSIPSFFNLPKQKPLSQRILRSPVELSCCLDSLLPYHTATSSALLTSMIFQISRRSSWLSEGTIS